ncbi:MAG TPA: type I glutamate--ammonia ligase [Stellaceae bacterium]|nr:type I glutamate--ammonia ligase [Stellaceae bacterium]
MADANKVMDMIKEHDAKYVDFRFTDPRGKWQHLTYHVQAISADFMKGGVMFDGSSIAGWKVINESDMMLVPDYSTAVLDPFAAQTTIVLFCDAHEPLSGQPYGRDPRSIAKKAEKYLASSGIGDKAFFGPEAEFFVFDDVRYKSSMETQMYTVDSEEGPYYSDRKLPDGNMGHRPPIKGGYFPVAPVDSTYDLRSEMLSIMAEMGLKVEKHHHEVAPAQHELGFEFDTLVRTADNMQIYKYVVLQVANQYGKTATFMPKPIKGDNGSGMHVHQSVWKGDKPLFAGSGYADLSDFALHYIGGLIKHAKAINAFTNPTTNSYKRLIPGFEAPVLLAYSARNRSASCRIPIVSSPKAKRVECRFPDPAANPYLGFAAMLMAGIDGVQNRIHPGEAMDKNLYDLPPEELKGVPTVCGSLREAMESLRKDHGFLTKGDVFTKDFIDSYIDLKFEEIYKLEHTPHPIEFEMYYSV